MAVWYTNEEAKRFEGVFSLLLTPFHANKEINWKCYDAYVDWQLAHHPHGLFGVCGTSEMKWLTLDERLELARRAVKQARHVPVVCTGNAGEDRSAHLEEVKRMADTGVAAIVLVPPEGLGADQRALADYYAELADAAPCPTFIYEWPLRNPYLVESETYKQLAKHHNIWGIKDTTCSIEHITAKIKGVPESIVYQANHPFMLDAIRNGARGIMAISTAANADLVLRFWHEAITGGAQAEELLYVLVSLDSLLIHNNAYPCTAKLFAQLRGMELGLACRNPAVLRKETIKAATVWYDYHYAMRTGG